MPESQQTLTDTSIEVVNGQTIMKFTKLLVEEGEIEITTADNIFLWAHGGSSDQLGYHGAGRESFELNLSGEAADTVVNVGDEVCITGYIMDKCECCVFFPCKNC